MGPSVDPHLYQATHGDIQTIEKADINFLQRFEFRSQYGEIFNEMAKTKPVLAIGDTIDEKLIIKR